MMNVNRSSSPLSRSKDEAESGSESMNVAMVVQPPKKQDNTGPGRVNRLM